MNTQLTLSTTHRVVGGVAGGLGEYLQVDPAFVRIGFLVLGFATPIGIPLYLLLWFAMGRPDGQNLVQRGIDSARQGATQLGSSFRSGPHFDPQTGAPISTVYSRNQKAGMALMGLGALMLASMLHIAAPLIAIAFVATGWYLLKH
ncbi:MAG: PspC domain-containing protein [Herpetosiphonaceae bacterium]|nr:PspC domain-containing protein [Herpetosiphonaceae bacterium]